ncbi:MAG: DUF5685 family protein [Oscillospiraceae bacterium]|nr:DUF5685 family protein [Oscillospiraceae bacterium]
MWENDAYQGVYCGLCHTIGKRHGFWGRMLLNYDFVFLSVLLTPQTERPTLEKKRCPARLYCTRRNCVTPSAGMDCAADESTVLAYWKLRDTVADAPFWKRQGARLLTLLFRPAYRRAAGAVPAFDALTEESLAALRVLEEEGCPSLDRTADAFASILRAAAPTTGDVARDRAMGELLYHVGRWIYLLDAWDDMEEDKKNGAYNPILARYGDDGAGRGEDIRLTLRHSCNLARSAFQLLDMGSWKELVENILYLGLPSMEEAVFSGERRRARKTFRRYHT